MKEHSSASWWFAGKTRRFRPDLWEGRAPRERDALVARAVMGWTPRHADETPPAYTSDAGHIPALLDRLASGRRATALTVSLEHRPDFWTVALTVPLARSFHTDVVATGATLSDALSQATLIACDVDVDGWYRNDAGFTPREILVVDALLERTSPWLLDGLPDDWYRALLTALRGHGDIAALDQSDLALWFWDEIARLRGELPREEGEPGDATECEDI